LERLRPEVREHGSLLRGHPRCLHASGEPVSVCSRSTARPRATRRNRPRLHVWRPLAGVWNPPRLTCGGRHAGPGARGGSGSSQTSSRAISPSVSSRLSEASRSATCGTGSTSFAARPGRSTAKQRSLVKLLSVTAVRRARVSSRCAW
jgi:hypothetical protein